MGVNEMYLVAVGALGGLRKSEDCCWLEVGYLVDMELLMRMPRLEPSDNGLISKWNGINRADDSERRRTAIENLVGGMRRRRKKSAKGPRIVP